MRISDWSSDVCSSDLAFVSDRLINEAGRYLPPAAAKLRLLHRYGNSEVRNAVQKIAGAIQRIDNPTGLRRIAFHLTGLFQQETPVGAGFFEFIDQRAFGALIGHRDKVRRRSEAHTSELQSLMRISYAVFCLKKN